MSVEADVQESLGDVYAHQVQADLERIDAEIAQAEARLKALHADRALLGRLWENLGGVMRNADAVVASPKPKAPVPPARSHTRSQSSAADAEPAADAAAKAEAKRRGPTAKRGSIRDAVLKYLRTCDEPVSVNDIFGALPGKVQASGKVVVRNTVEALVARGAAERSRDGQFVRYTLVATAADADA